MPPLRGKPGTARRARSIENKRLNAEKQAARIKAASSSTARPPSVLPNRLTTSGPRPPAANSAARPPNPAVRGAAEFVVANRNYANESIKNKSRAGRDISPLPVDGINWERRLECKLNLKRFCELFLPNVFNMGWSHDQLEVIGYLEETILNGGMFCLAMPRAGGKTALCRAAIIWASAYGHRRFMYFVGSTQTKAQQTLDFIKMYWFRNKILREDFPEVGWPIYKLENRYHLASGQTYNGESTHVIWGGDVVRFPSLLLQEEVAQVFLEKDPDSLVKSPYEDQWVPKQAGLYIATAGIDGSIRGEADVNPITLEQPRPDLCLLDDVQKDQKAESPTSVEKIVNLIDGAITGLAGPGQHIAALMPCTVIREGDAADIFLDPMQKPDWNGRRFKLVMSWPKGITDYEVRYDTPAGQKWNQYADLRRKSLLLHRDIRLATDFYRLHENREIMDEGFVPSWPERYKKTGKNPELSPQQHAMELRFKSPKTFPPEYQNIGRKMTNEGEMLITATQLMEKTVSYNWMQIPSDAEIICAFIDVQNEGFIWEIFACNHDFTGIFPAWGLWPEVDSHFFSRDQMDSWSLLTNKFFQHHPHLRKEATKTSRGHLRAPFEAKIYFGLGKIVEYLMSLTFKRTDANQKEMKIQRIGIDTRYGQANDTIKRFIRESKLVNMIIPYSGQPLPPTNLQLEEYKMADGWWFEHQQHPHVKEPMWVIRPNNIDRNYYMMADVNRGKSFLFRRLGSPRGTPGSISLPNLPIEHLELIANQICSSEYPETVVGRINKDMWKERENVAWDNDLLDCSVGNMMIASCLGASIKTGEDPTPAAPVSFSKMYQDRRRGE